MTTTADQGLQSDGAWRVRAIAATLGAFDPRQLLDPNKERELALLGQLATDCEEVVTVGQIRWILKPDVRFRVLGELARDELLVLMDTAPPSNDDELGRLLQGMLRSGAPIAPVPSTDLSLLRTALRFVAPAVGEKAAREAVQQVDLRLSRHDANLAIQVLLPHRLVGRRKELGRLRRFVNDKANLLAEDILWVTGVGGTGKSALLAEFARTLRGEHWDGTPVLQVDFDRPALYRGTLTTLMMEVSRQLELYFPNMAPALATYRRTARLSGPVEIYKRQETFEILQHAAVRSASAWQEAMQGYLPIEKKLVLVLDTAEEIGLSSSFDLAGLRSWLRQLRKTEGLPNLRVVLSGRAFHADQLALVPARQRLELGDLMPDDAIEFVSTLLERKGVIHSYPLDKLVDMLGGNPLSLKILASYLTEGGEDAVNHLMADRTDFDQRFAQSFLYKRILGRLRTEDQDLVKIAHPGLVLRRVTPDLIRHVLAEPCDLQDVDEVRSHALFQHLVGQVWLVQSTANPDVVIHRRDLRRLMLQAMSAQDATRALAIHRAAAEYYQQKRDPFMTRQEQAIERHYHALFLPAAVLPDIDILESVARTLGEDLDTLPMPVRAQFKLALGRQLTDVEQQRISSADRALYRSLLERNALKLTGEYRAGTSLSSPEEALGIDSRLLESELHAAFESGNLSAVARSASDAVRIFAESLIREYHYELDSDLTESAVWRAALASMGQSDFVRALMETLPSVSDAPAWHNSIGRSSRVELTGSEAYHMLFRLHGADCPAPLSSPESWSGRLSGTPSLRRFQLLDPMPYTEVQVPSYLLRDLSAEFVSYFSTNVGTDNVVLDAAAVEDLREQQLLRAGNKRVTLNDLDKLGRHGGGLWMRSVLELPREAKPLLLGRLPEVYVLIRAAARACKLNVLVDFAEEANRDQLWPVELDPSSLRANLVAERERWTVILITIVDRFGLLRIFLDWLEDRGRLKGRSLSLIRTVRDYELRLRQFL